MGQLLVRKDVTDFLLPAEALLSCFGGVVQGSLVHVIERFDIRGVFSHQHLIVSSGLIVVRAMDLQLPFRGLAIR